MTNDNESQSMTKIAITIGAIMLLVIGIFTIKIRTVSGNELGVLETWGDGVIQTPLQPKTHIFMPGFNKTVYTYNMGMNALVYNNTSSAVETVAHGREHDAYMVQSADQQDMHISFRLQWRRRPEAVVKLHTIARDNVEELLLRTPVLNVVKNHATVLKALDAYSGTGLVKLQDDILRDLQSNEELKQYVIIDGFVVEHIGLEKKYTDEIVARQVAIQEKLKNEAKTAAATAAAEMAKAQAQADYEKQIVEAKRDKERGILAAEQGAQQQVLNAQAQAKQTVLNAEAQAEQVTLTARAEKNRNVLIAEGEKEAALNRAAAIEAIGKADADALRLKLSAYAAQGAEGYVRIQVANSMALAFQNIKGYLPEKMSVNLLAEQYNKGVNLLVSPTDTKLLVSPTDTK